MNTVAITLPARHRLSWSRLRGLYNGVGYVLAISLLLNLWGGLQQALPRLLSGDASAALRVFADVQWLSLWAELPGPLLIPPAVNLAPRAGWRRPAWLLAMAFPLWWWCLAVVERVRFGWDWPSLGFVLDGVVTTGLVVGVCLYHNDSRAAADALARSRIDHASMDAELQRAQLQLLRAQIEPHFLFNTLSVVQALARSDRAATVTMLDNLMRYFEGALPQLRSGEVPLAQELRLVEAYLAIYRARMGSRLHYRVSCPEALAQLRIPTMVLLTLVENALKHGVAPAVEGGAIVVSAERKAGAVLLRVTDSGRGFDARQGHGAGLANIRQRLLMTYGERAVLSLRVREPRGMVASVWLPQA